jgi:hypothetical protein
MQGRNHTAWKQNPTITIMFHESIAILLKNAPFFEVPLSNGRSANLASHPLPMDKIQANRARKAKVL